MSSPFFEMLKQVPHLKIVLVVVAKKREFFEKVYFGDHIFIEGIPRKLNELDYFLRDLASASITTRSRARIKKMRLGHERWNALRLLFWAPPFRSFIPTLYSVIVSQNRYAELFEKYKPDLVFATDVFNPMDVILMHEAKHRGIRVVGMVRSWDNLTAKGGFRVIPDTLVVQNNIIKDDAMRIHRIPERIIKVVGIPHYDKYREYVPIDRQEFFRRLKRDPNHRLILYAPLGDRFFSNNTFDGEMICMLLEILPEGYDLFVRCPPGDTVNSLGVPKHDPRLIIEQPGTFFPGAGVRAMDTELSPEDDDWLVSTIAHSELLVSGFTTLIVDAARFDKPIILVGFDAQTPLPYDESVRRHLEFEHIEPVLKSGGVKLVNSALELKEALALYLKHPEADREARRKMVEEQSLFSDGKSSERLLQVIVGEVGN